MEPNLPTQPFQPGKAVVPATQVEISVSCRNLKDKDVFSKSDPMCVMFMKELGRDVYYESGRTEVIKDCLSPEFVKKFNVKYFFEESQRIKFEVYDVDSPSGRLDNHDFLGRCECTLGEIIGSPSGKLEKSLVGAGRNAGWISLRAEEVANCKELINLQFKATNLDKKDFFGKSDPYLVFYRANEDGSYTTVHKTEVVKNTLNPTWRPFTCMVRTLCNGDYDRTIKVECYDWDSDGGHDFIGHFVTNMRELTNVSATNTYEPVQNSGSWECINPKKKAKKKAYRNSGQVQLIGARIEVSHSFIDYIQHGTQMNFTVAIDFTASNGNPSQPTSLHYLSPYQPNHYAGALQAVGEIIQDYDSDKMFPALGFGARLPPDGRISHEFALNSNPQNPYCQGIPGVLQAYYQSLQNVQLYGPTNFAPVIQHVAKFASAINDGSNYFVLLIITDGVISDMPQTVDAIVQASSLPMSIIIVGVGDADFTAMDILDADNQKLQSRGRVAEHDIVQFVPFREFTGRQGNNMQISQAQLAKEVLAEVPDQVLFYMKKHRIDPQHVKRQTPSQPGPNANQPSQSGQMANQSGMMANQQGQPGQNVNQPGQPGQNFNQPGQNVNQPGQPGQNVNQPGQPGQNVNQPGQPGQNFNQPGQPGQNFNQPGQNVNQPGQPGQNFNQPGQPGQNFNQQGQPRQNFNQQGQPGQMINQPPGYPGQSFSQQQPGPHVSPRTQPGQNASPYPQPGQAGSPYPQPGQAGSPYPQPGQAGSPYPQPGQVGSPYPQPGQAGSPYPQSGSNIPHQYPTQPSQPNPQAGQGQYPGHSFVPTSSWQQR